MFKTLSDSLNKVFDKIRDRGVLTENQINDSMREIRIALLEADVSLPVVQEFIKNVSERAKGSEIVKSTSPAQTIVKIVNDEMIKLLSSKDQEANINFNNPTPINILMLGLQGSGKTTASAKLALKLKKEGKKILLVSLDTYRPAAQEQLQILAKNIEVDSLPIIKEESPLEITKRAITNSNNYDVVIYDSAGRLHVDEDMIRELMLIEKNINAVEKLLVIDSMIGQDSIKVAKTFNEKLDITGIILSRIDGDARGGAALSIRHAIGKPIKFLSSGEKPEEFEIFDAKRITSRILGMGDVVSLVEQASAIVDRETTEKTVKKIQKGRFNLNDYISQIRTVKKMGGIERIFNMIPGMSKIADKISGSKIDDNVLIMQEAIVLSMTHKERRIPDILNASRKKRIAEGSGTKIQQINMLLKQFKQMKKMMKQFLNKN